MKRLAIVSAASVAILLAVFAAGRWTAPAQYRDRVVTVDREVSTYAAAYVGRVERNTETNTKWRERIVYTQGQTVVEREQVRDEKTAEKRDESRAQSGTSVTEKTSDTEHAPVVPRPRWAVEALGGVTLDERRPVGGVGAQVRIGDWWVGAWGMATTETRATGASLRREF